MTFPLPSMNKPFETLASTLREMNGDRTLLFVVNHGNWGDALIREGAEAFLKFHGFRYVSVPSNKLMDGAVSIEDAKRMTGETDPVMVYNGSGALRPQYDRVAKIAQLSHQFSRSLLFPSTFGVAAADFDFSANMQFFVRDQEESLRNCPGAPFCHDMAFFYTPNRFPKPTRKWGLFLRDDPESPQDLQIPEGYGNFDISQAGRAKTPIHRFMKTLAKYERIYTNRLHVSIGGALLGREVFLSSNDYFKIRAIFNASLADYFPNVHFSETFDLEQLNLQKPSRLQRYFPRLRK